MKILFKLLIGVVFLGSLFGGVLYLDQQGHFQMEDFEIQVTGEKIDPLYLAPYLQNIESRLSIYKGKSLFELPLTRISESFAHEAWVKSVSIVRRWPNQIMVTLEPRPVVMAYFTKGGDAKLIDEMGDLMGSVTTENVPDVAIAQGEAFEDDVDLRKKAVDLLTTLPEKGVLSRESVSTVSYDKSKGFWISLMDEGLEVRMGEQDFEKKSKRVAQVLRYMRANQFEGRMIDANFDRKVLVRLKKN